MRYAVISDIHGNLPALKAVLTDARAHGVDAYLLLGDYTTCFPWGNEVTELIRGLHPATVIRGNGEGYFIDYRSGRFELNNEQFRPAHWDYCSLRPENLDYLIALPETADVAGMHLSHTMDLFHHEQTAAFFRPSMFRAMLPLPHEAYLARAREAVLACPQAMADICALPEGVYLFGHNHMQFHMEHAGRLFVNPGSCGQALDGDTRAAYTLLTEGGNAWTVMECRVEYDLNAAAEGLHASGFFAAAPIWGEIIQRELMSGANYMTPFVMHLMATGQALGRDEYPVSDDTWNAAARAWDADKI